jgi:hypothetical protein
MIDPTERGTVAIYVALLWLGCDFLFSLAQLPTIAVLDALPQPTWISPADADALTGITGLMQFSAFVVSAIFVSRWVLRINANAHELTDMMTMTPRWNVGWFFIPVATLWKPFEGIRQSYQASIDGEFPDAVEVPAIFRWWWGLWLITNWIGGVAFRLEMTGKSLGSLQMASWLNLISFAVDLPLTYCLIRVINEVNRAQRQAQAIRESSY